MKALLRLYPRAWRERYQSEMEAVLDGMPFGPRAALDLVACAADAHLHPLSGPRRPAPLALQLTVLVLVAMLAFPAVESAVESLPALRYDGLAYGLAPVAAPLLGAVLSWWARWRLATWFFTLAAVQAALTGDTLLVVLPQIAERPLEPIRQAVAGWHPASFRLLWPFSAAVIVGAGVLAALELRRLGTPWPVGLAIGVALVGSADVWLLYDYARPMFAFLPPHPDWFRLWWLVTPTQVGAWAALTAALLRRSGLPWWVGFPAGCFLWAQLGDSKLGPGYPLGLLPGQFISTMQLPSLAWAVVVAVLAGWRWRESAPREAMPC